MFTLTKNNVVVSPNGKFIGEIYQEVDGFYVFEFHGEVKGYLPQHFFTSISKWLKDLNDPVEQTYLAHHDAY